jgi:hypothetical protein
MSPRPLSFHVNYSQPGQFMVSLEKVAKSGAHLRLAVDGRFTETDFPAAESDYNPVQKTLSVNVPAGPHTITLENDGTDWVAIHRFTLTNYSPALAGYALVGSNYVAAWVYHRANVITDERLAPAVSGLLTISGLKPDSYRATWMDTRTGELITVNDIAVRDSGAVLHTPAISRDAAVFIEKRP